MFTPYEYTVEKVQWNGEGHVEIRTTDRGEFSGMNRKDFFNAEEDWESRIVPSAKLRYWTIQFSRVIGVEWWDGNEWQAIWVKGNDFGTKAEREKAGKAYANFIVNEGKTIAVMIDQGKTLEEINAAISKDHTGNTYGMALYIAIDEAKDRKAAEAIRQAHNARYGVPSNKSGVVNPAVMTLNV